MNQTDIHLDELSNSQLYKLCRQYGTQTLRWRWKFAGLLPEVKRRELYLKKGYASIYEFAARLAGMPREQVTRVIHVDMQLADKPLLRQMLVEGQVSVNKLARVAGIATAENQHELAIQVRQLSQHAAQILVKDFKNNNGLNKPKIDEKPVSAHGSSELGLSDEVIAELLVLKQKGIDINAELKAFLERRKDQIEKEKHEVALSLEIRHDAAIVAGEPVGGRYIPMAVKRIIEKEYGKKCAIPDCAQLSEELHHSARFSLSRNHDPHYLAPLCHGHHEIAHSVDIRVQEKKVTGG